FDYAYEVDKTKPEPRYSQNSFAVNFSTASSVHVATREEWQNASRIATKPRYVFPLNPNDSSGEIEYKHRHYPKVGKYCGQGLLLPTGKWLAIFSYNGENPPPEFIHFISGGSPREGDIFWQIYDTTTGNKVFEWDAKNVKGPTSLDGPVVWLEDRYFLFPQDQTVATLNVVTLPPLTPEINPVTMQLPSRRDATGRLLPAPTRHEVWGPQAGLSKEQAAALTAPCETEISEFRLSDQSSPELLLAIKEESESRMVNRQQRDGAGEYHYRLLNTYY